MTTPSFGELIEKVKTTYNFTDNQAYAYLASAFFGIASDESVNRVNDTIGFTLE